jgi:hypothetical protein
MTLTEKKLMRRPWTDEDDDFLRTRYPTETADFLATALNRNASSVYARVSRLGIRKSEAFRLEQREKITRGLIESGKKSQFSPGSVPWNAGKRYSPGGKSIDTRFQPGRKLRSWKPIGTERLNNQGYLERKVLDTGVTKVDYRLVHHLVWECAGRTVTPGHALVFRDGNKANVSLENLELIDRKTLMGRNSINNYGPEVAMLSQLRGAISRQINKLTTKDNRNGK